MVDILNIGAGAAQVYRSALSTVSNNIANLNTDGYTRQVSESAQNIPVQMGGMYVGDGARLASITRAFSEFNESNLRNSSSELETQDPMIQYADRIVDVMGSTTSGLSSALDNFFGAARDLSSDPGSITLRNGYLRDAEGLSVRFQELAGQLSNIEDETESGINLQVTSLNSLGEQLFDVNRLLEKNFTVSEQPPALLDQRDSILRDMAKIAKINVKQNTSGSVEIRLDSDVGTLVVDAQRVTVFSATFQPGQTVILADVYGTPNPTTSVVGGSLGGILNFRSQILAPTIAGLDTLATTVATEINTLQTTGVDANGVRGTNLFDPGVNTTGAAGFSMLQTDPYQVATAGLLRITANAGNSGTAKLDYSQIAAGTATPTFTLTFTTAAGYRIGGAAIAVDANGDFTHEGINYSVTGTPEDGDSFAIGLNTNAAGDNRNVRLIAQLQTKQVTAQARTIGDGYTDLVNSVGSASSLAKISQDALQVVHDQAVMEKDKLSGVSLDQEAADLIRFQQAFQAAAQIIQTSNKMFDAIVNIR
tara:strand:- start:3384 stop:4988 length:1605 start_codon:yes stop_codon:yes gene_type:complete